MIKLQEKTLTIDVASKDYPVDQLFDWYNEFLIPETCVQNSWKALYFGLAEEVGELMGIFKRIYRNDENYTLNNPEILDKIIKEFGDIIWYICAINAYHGQFNYNFAHKDIKQIGLFLPRHFTKRDYTEYLPSCVADIKNCQAMGNVISLSYYCNLMVHKIVNSLNYFDIEVKTVLLKNIEKLTKRKEQNLIKGTGDDR